MTNNKLPLIHIGLPKAGSSTLQECLFSKHPELEYLGQSNLHQNKNAKYVIKSILKDGYFETDSVKKHVETICQDIKSKGKTLLVSDEAISFGEFLLRGQQWEIISDHSRTANNIRHILGPSQILVVLRAQIDWLISMHKQGLKNGRYTHTSFDTWLTHEMANKKDHLFALMDYHNLYQSYADTFGKDSVHILFYEDYNSDFKNIGLKIGEICGVDAKTCASLIGDDIRNKSDETFTTIPLPIKKIFQNTLIGNVKHLIPEAIKRWGHKHLSKEQEYSNSISCELRDMIFQNFRDSNRALCDELNHKPKATELYY